MNKDWTCSSPDIACGSLPPGFTRLRYFFGKRLQVADFVDEQRYHAGKMRFHNQRAHGSGVLCGLAVGLFEADSAVLRVGKGAALDPCGREIVVGYDQCIDVDAWYRRMRDAALDADPTSTWPADLLDGDGLLPLCVVLRYRECPTGLEPAPRDPCSNDVRGGDFGRVREQFELALEVLTGPLATEQGSVIAPAARPGGLHPTRADIERILTSDAAILAAENLSDELGAAIAAGCGQTIEPADAGLVLACLRATLSADSGRVVALSDIELRAPVLHNTALLQELLGRQLRAGLQADALLADNPAVHSLSITPHTISSGSVYRLNLELTGPVFGLTVPTSAFVVRRLDPVSGWQEPTATAQTSYDDTSEPKLVIQLDNSDGFLVDGGRYRLTQTVDADKPIVDEEMRPLLPLRLSVHFALVDQSGTLTVQSVSRTV